MPRGNRVRRGGRARWRPAPLLLAALALLGPGPALAQGVLDHRGAEFFLPFLPNKDDEGPVSLSLEISSETTVNAVVEYPVGKELTTVTVTPAQITTVAIPLQAHTGWGGGAVTENAVRVGAEADVSVVMITRGFGADDRALALPVEALGREHIIMSRSPGQTNGSQYAVVARQDTTSVRINGGENILLQRGQGFLRTGPNLAGTSILSDKPVAVSNGNRCASVPAATNFCEHMLEFAVPVEHWGSEVLARNTPNVLGADGTRNTYFRILASQDGTQVDAGGSVRTLQRGEVFEILRGASQPATHISASGPILVAQYSNSVCDEFPDSLACTGGSPNTNEYGDASMATLLSTDQYVQRSRFGVPRISSRLRLNLIARTTDVDRQKVLLDGSPIAATAFTAFAGAPEYSHAELQIVADGLHTIEAPGGHSATLFEHAGFTTLSWPAAMQFVPLTLPVCGNGIVEIGEGCDLNGGNGEVGVCCSTQCEIMSVGSECRPTFGNPCDVPEFCDGVDFLCPANQVAGAGSLCRAAAGTCDVEEVCNGVNASCPANSLAGAGTQCRAANGVCDVAETCSGSTASCPANGFRGAGILCRAANGVCDVAETCSGSAPSCPADSFAGAGAQCRTANGVCDVAETCSGSTPSCPANGFRGAGTECRPASGTCDAAETCTGSAAACPADAVAPDGTLCNDGQACTSNDACLAGSCLGADNDIDADADEHYQLGSCLSPADDCDDGNGEVYPGAPEVCDALDNNCDDAVDEGFVIEDCGVGICFNRVDTCQDGTPQQCVPLPAAADEICNNGLDDDCNGIPDDASQCGSLFGGWAEDVELAGGRIFVAAQEAGLRILQLVNGQPDEIGALAPPTCLDAGQPVAFFADDVDIDGQAQYAYLALGPCGVWVVDVSVPEEPLHVGSYDTDNWTQDVLVVGDRAYVADHNGGLLVLGVSDPQQPTLLGGVGAGDATFGAAIDVEVRGSAVYVATTRGLQIVDAAVPTNLVSLGSFLTDPNSGPGQDVELVGYDSGAIAYLSAWRDGVFVLDVSIPSDLQVLAHIPSLGLSFEVTVSGNTAFVADGGYGLRLFDVSDAWNQAPAERVASPFATLGFAWDVDVLGNSAYIAYGESPFGDLSGGLQVVGIAQMGLAPSDVAPAPEPGAVLQLVTALAVLAGLARMRRAHAR